MSHPSHKAWIQLPTMQNSSCLPSLWRICKWRLLKKHVTSSVDCISAISSTHYELLALITHHKNTLLLSCFPAFFITTSLSPPPSPLSVPYIPKKHVTNLVDYQWNAQIMLTTQYKLLALFERMTQKKKQMNNSGVESHPICWREPARKILRKSESARQSHPCGVDNLALTSLDQWIFVNP